MKIFKLFIFILIILKSFYSLSNSISKQEAALECENLPDKKTLTTAWYINEPYQYWMVTSNGTANVSGMDIELINALAAKIGINIEGTVKLSKLVSQSTIFLDFRQQEVFE
ncbi:hypothetical protein [Rickettsia sp. MEAM1 (Bemisia tabaci)]|uniref:hypothetical protein n=1 Tax=Rickettsia sp. MEAM1 (Bemisia tabaci) TaxID=1182263 RepID=UPI001E5783A1|nr:hypothetical protein [Rickettsia sp. MEAM1 (Bemisia tabaci)]